MDVKSRFDAIVAGAGAGGAAAAWRLTQKGLRVLLLDAGPRFSGTDYRLDQPDWERHHFPAPPGSRGGFAFGALGRLDPAHADLRSWSRVSGQVVRDEFRQPLGEGYWHVQGLGGSTLAFVGESHRLHPAAFRLRQQFGAGCDWPLDYADLEPYYAMCETLVGVAGPAEQGERWRSAAYPLPPHPLSPPARRLLEAGQQLGMRWQENSRAALSRPYDGRPACNYCGNCSRGCPIGDKGSTDVTFLRKAEVSGLLTVKTGAPLVRIHAGAGGRIREIEYLDGKTLRRIPVPLLVLAAGAVQTPRLLLANADRRHPGGLANGSGQVGRNFMETLFWHSAGVLPGLANSHMGLPSDAISWDHNAPDAIPGVVGGCRFNSNAQEVGFTGPIAYATRVVPGFGQRLKEGVRSRFGSVLSVGAVGEFLPNDGSYIDLDPRQTDRFGMALPRIHSRLEAPEIARLRFMADRSRRLLQAAGVEQLVEEYSAWDSFSATHVFGTCRMGGDPRRSVVDARGRSHDHPNLYIVDASVFPSSGGGESPSLTIQALAVRAADAMTGGETLSPSRQPG